MVHTYFLLEMNQFLNYALIYHLLLKTLLSYAAGIEL